MKKMAKDIMMFSGASMIGGAGALGAGALGMGSAVSGVSTMMPVVGTTMMAGHTVRIASQMMPKSQGKRKGGIPKDVQQFLRYKRV